MSNRCSPAVETQKVFTCSAALTSNCSVPQGMSNISALCLKEHDGPEPSGNACALPALSFLQVGRSLISDDSEFLLFLFLEQSGSRRLSSSTMRPNSAQIGMLSLSSALQRERSAAYSIWESKYLNHNLLLDFYCLYLQ